MWPNLQFWSHLLKKSLMENFIFCAAPYIHACYEERSTSLFGVPVPEIVTRHSGPGASHTVTLSAGSLGLPVLYFYLLYSPFLWVLLMVISITITIKKVAMRTKMSVETVVTHFKNSVINIFCSNFCETVSLCKTNFQIIMPSFKKVMGATFCRNDAIYLPMTWILITWHMKNVISQLSQMLQ